VKQETNGTRDPQVIVVLDSGSHINAPVERRRRCGSDLAWAS